MKINDQSSKILFSGLLFGSILLVGFNYLTPEKKESDIEFELIKRYLVNNSSLAKSDKPILWLHNEYKVNDRNWESFGSRNTNELNKPLVYLTIDSMIKKCDKSFNICLIDDNSFINLIPGWKIDMETVPDPTKKYYRLLAFLHLIYIYGGMIAPPTLLCFQNLFELFKNFTINDNCFVTECNPSSIISSHSTCYPCTKVIGSIKNNESINEMIRLLENRMLKSVTNETNFTGFVEMVINKFIKEKRCNLISGKVFGYYDEDGKVVSITDLMSDVKIELHAENVGLDIPIDEIIVRKNYDWFSKLNLDELPKANNNIGYLLNRLYC
jgi:hypothetical protein